MDGITANASYHTWWCIHSSYVGKHKDPRHHGHLNRDEQFSIAKAIGTSETYQTNTQYNPSIPTVPAYDYQESEYALIKPLPNEDPGHQGSDTVNSANSYGLASPVNQSLQLAVRTHNGDPGIADYSVGWICANDTAYVAACELLEKEFSPLRCIPVLDDNYYTYGRIGSHNVVMTCLPRGRYGMTSATGVAINMRRTFPNLRIRLMVGIGGGAPTKKNDIRLGDVIVSIPIGRTGGVIHYESGKTIQNRQFKRIGHLDAPPKFLLNAVNALDTSHQRRGHNIQQTIQQIIEQNPRLRTKYCPPDHRMDILHASTCLHVADKLECIESCSLAVENVVRRRPREPLEDDPKIHYGLIASADRLMEDAIVRDHLARTEGVMCFEMEAAGLMSDFPCLVIRGICDYSDTHKNDLWQGYAALTAAAYAKELLLSIPPALPARRS